MKINYKPVKLFIPMLIMIGVSCKDEKQNANEIDSEIVYEVSILKTKQVSNQLILPGELQGYYETGIIAKVNGYVKQILVDIGDKVTRGQLLVTLEAPELMNQLASAYSELQVKEAIYFNTKGKYSRLMQTNKTPGAVSPYDIDFAKTSIISDSLTFIASVSRFQSFQSLSDYLKIIAPFDGVITDRSLAPGAFVGPNDKNLTPILKLKNEARLRLHVAIPEKYIAEIKTGDLVHFKVRSFPDKSFKGRITRLANNINTQTRSEIIEIEIENATNQLLPGMFAQATIPIQRLELSFVVPQSAVVTNMERSFVIKVTQNRNAVWLDVQKGELQGDNVEVFGNLSEGDTILNEASDEIKDRASLKVIMVPEKNPR